MKRARPATVALISIVCSFSGLIARAERVAYWFQGTLKSKTQPYHLFGYDVPGNTVVSGTFSYDTTKPATEIQSGVDEYHQYIDAGLTLDVNQGQVKIRGSDYAITVGNDYSSPSFDFFSVDYVNFGSNGVDPTVKPLIITGANGTLSWTGLASIKVDLSWSADTFPDPSLTPGAPITPDSSVTAFVGSADSGTGVPVAPFSPPLSPSPFMISAISLIAGDYNGNDEFDSGDYSEWRKVYDCSDDACLYADGNGDGVVDGADYVVWRHSLAVASGSGVTQLALVPEPSTIALCCLALAWPTRRR